MLKFYFYTLKLWYHFVKPTSGCGKGVFLLASIHHVSEDTCQIGQTGSLLPNL
jgi:hypothetical protein